MKKNKTKVLFLCVHNSARSQMAEAFLKKFYPDRFEVKSAGVVSTKLNPYVVKVMEEIGIDMSSHYSKSMKVFLDDYFDLVVAVCDNLREKCPYFPKNRKYIHKKFEDPSSVSGSEEEKLKKIRKIRDEIQEWVENYFSNRFVSLI